MSHNYTETSPTATLIFLNFCDTIIKIRKWWMHFSVSLSLCQYKETWHYHLIRRSKSHFLVTLEIIWRWSLVSYFLSTTQMQHCCWYCVTSKRWGYKWIYICSACIFTPQMNIELVYCILMDYKVVSSCKMKVLNLIIERKLMSLLCQEATTIDTFFN